MSSLYSSTHLLGWSNSLEDSRRLSFQEWCDWYEVQEEKQAIWDCVVCSDVGCEHCPAA